MGYFKNFTYDFPKNWHAAPYRWVMRFCKGSLFLEICACWDIREKRVQKRRKIRNLEENRLYLLNGWFLWPGSAGQLCRTALHTLDRVKLIGPALLATENLLFPYDQTRYFWALLAIFVYFSLRRSCFIDPFVKHKVVAHVMVRLRS